MDHASAFTGSIPELYERHLGPVLFEPYAVDLAGRIKGPVGQLLEIACGTGRLTAHLLEGLAPGGRLVATDLNADMLQVAKKRVQDPRLSWALADAGKLPFDDAEFDLVACQFGVMFFPDKVGAFEEVRRVLRPGGTWLFNTWDGLDHNPRPAIIRQVLDNVFGADKHAFTTKGPYSYHDREAIRRQLDKAGFTEVRIESRAIVTQYESAADFLTGFIDGSTLAQFLRNKAPELQERVRRELAQQMEALDKVLGSQVPMQALVVEAKKLA